MHKLSKTEVDPKMII